MIKKKGFDPSKYKALPQRSEEDIAALNRLSKRVSGLEEMLDNEELMERNKADKNAVKRDLLEIFEETKKYSKEAYTIERLDLNRQIRSALKKCN